MTSNKAQNTMSKKYENLLILANTVKENAYSPYSKFKVGAALLTKNGNTFVGCNVENAAYGDTICAERHAIGNAIVNGYGPDDFEAIAVASSGKNFSPCGSCRQVIQEFGSDIMVIFEFDGQVESIPLSELLPKGYSQNV